MCSSDLNKRAQAAVCSLANTLGPISPLPAASGLQEKAVWLLMEATGTQDECFHSEMNIVWLCTIYSELVNVFEWLSFCISAKKKCR